MSSFSNVDSCDRIVYGVISHLNRPWERKTALQIYTKPVDATFASLPLTNDHQLWYSSPCPRRSSRLPQPVIPFPFILLRTLLRSQKT
jgi:hypothetical protein